MRKSALRQITDKVGAKSTYQLLADFLFEQNLCFH